MKLEEIIQSIANKHPENGISLNPPATIAEFEKAETKLGFQLPADFREFYSLCNGFECEEDIFNFLSLKDLFLDSDYGKDCVIFAEYMIYSDVWVLRKLPGDSYEIIYNDGEETILTTSLTVFLEKLVHGHVLEEGGLFKWCDEIRRGQN